MKNTGFMKRIISFLLIFSMLWMDVARAMDEGEEREFQRSVTPSVTLSSANELFAIGEENAEDGDDGSGKESPPFLPAREKEAGDGNLICETSLKRLQKAENRPFFVKWVSVDHLLEKIAYSLWIGKRNVTGKSPKGLLESDPLWIEGRGIPLKSNFAFARGISGFRQGVEFVFKRSLYLTLEALLGYQIYEQVTSGQGFQALPLLEIVFNGDDTSIKAALSLVVQNPEHAPYFLSLFALPFVWGGVKSLTFARNALNDNPQKAIKVVEDFSLKEHQGVFKSLWKDNIRWVLPFHPLSRAVNYLTYHLF